MCFKQKKKIIQSIFNEEYISYQIRAEIVDIYFDIRPTARFVLDYNKQAKLLAKFLISLNLQISVSDGYVLHNSEKKYQDWFLDKPNGKKMICFYISKKLNLSAKCKQMDETQNDTKFGNILGYPKCCVKYVERNKRPPTISESYNLYLHKNKYNPLLWPCSMVVDANLISHFPCNINCKSSINLAMKRWNLIKKYSRLKTRKHYINNLSKYFFLKNNKIKTPKLSHREHATPLFIL